MFFKFRIIKTKRYLSLRIYIESFERFNGEKLPNKKQLHSSIKNGKIDDDGKISDGHIDVNDYLTYKKS